MRRQEERRETHPPFSPPRAALRCAGRRGPGEAAPTGNALSQSCGSEDGPLTGAGAPRGRNDAPEGPLALARAAAADPRNPRPNASATADAPG